MLSIFLHGLGQRADSWDHVIADLKLDDAVMVPDFVANEKNENVDYQFLYNRIEKDIAGHSRDSVRLCGLSLGAVLSIHYAIDHPEMVESMILIAPQYKMPQTLLLLQNFIFRLMPETAFAETGMTKKRFIQLCESMSRLDFSEQIEMIKCPVLILCGDKDYANLKSARKLAALLPCASLRIVEGVGHEMNEQIPARLAQLINEHWGM